MDRETLLYLPYRTHYYLSLAMVGISLAFTIAIGYSLLDPEWVLLLPFLFVFASLMMAKFLYDTSKISVLFVAEGLWIVGQGKKPVQFYAWRDILYLTYARSKRGHSFVVLSKEELSKIQLEQYVAQSAKCSIPCVSATVVVLSIDPLQDTTFFLNFLNDKVSNIKKTDHL